MRVATPIRRGATAHMRGTVRGSIRCWRRARTTPRTRSGRFSAPILREIHALKPAPITGLDIAFAGNPSAPTDVLLDLARSSEEIEAVRALLRHPALDCAMIEGVVRGPAVRSHPDDADVTERLANARATRCR